MAELCVKTVITQQNMEDQPKNYSEIARASRIKCLELVFKAQTSHIGSLMSCADIMAVLFEKIDLDKDKFVLSAGWKAAMLYYHLWRKGRITEGELNSYCQEVPCHKCGFTNEAVEKYRQKIEETTNTELINVCKECGGKGMVQSKFIGLAEPVVPEIPIAGGSMGMGLPGAVGLALAKKLKSEEGKVYVLMSDGELAIGTTWESALIAAHHKLDNLVVVVDQNSWQAMGKTDDILSLGELSRKFYDLGFEVHGFNGHDFILIEEFLKRGQHKPMIGLAQTIKGKGWKRAENNNTFHYKAPSREEYEEALSELNA